MSDDKKVIFGMHKVSKVIPSGKQIIKNINLSFFYGAKIGIIGLNGSGKSTLLKIIAGLDKDFKGEVYSDKDFSVGLLEQEPVLDESKTVMEIVREGVQEIVDVLDEFNAINDKFAEPDVMDDPDAFQKLIDRQGELQDIIDAKGAWELDNKLERAMDALRTPDGDASVATLSGGEKRRVALCRLLLKAPDVLLLRELDWVRMAPKARHAKSKARLNNYKQLLAQETKDKEQKLEIFIPSGPRLGTNVIEAKNVSKAFGDKLLYGDLNFNLPPAGIVGIVGPNGAGKTTMFRMIMGLETPDEGTFEVGETVKVSYVDQDHKSIDTEKTVFENIADGLDNIELGGVKLNSRAYISRFNFGGQDQNKKVSVLSGGERNRLHLAMALKQEGNVLLLDEPTNDLDVNTLRALEEGLESFAGCAVIISHDRWFLDRVCTHILAFEGNSEVYYFEGSYSDYEENKLKRLGISEPKRIQKANE